MTVQNCFYGIKISSSPYETSKERSNVCLHYSHSSIGVSMKGWGLSGVKSSSLLHSYFYMLMHYYFNYNALHIDMFAKYAQVNLPPAVLLLKPIPSTLRLYIMPYLQKAYQIFIILSLLHLSVKRVARSAPAA